MASIEAKGKSVDEAIFNGLNQMGLGIDEVEIEIIHEGNKGLFGIGKSAVVKLTEKTEDVAAPVERKVRTRAKERSGDRDAAKRPAREKQERVKREPVETDGVAEAFLNGLFEKMSVSANAYAVEADGKTTKIDIEGKDTAVIIGRRGDTLDAVQYLTGLVANRGRTEYIKIMLDAEDYRSKREVTLQKLAKRLASNVIKSGKQVSLEPMNSYERRILHSALQSNDRVETYSEGGEPYRRVVIRKKRPDKAQRV